MKILKYKKIGKEKYRITLNNDKEVEVFEDLIVKHNLLLNKEITDDELSFILKQNDLEKNYFMALKYISIKMRSIHDVKRYLTEKKVSDKDVLKITNRLVKEGYLNDLAFTKAFINDQINITPNGPLKIKNELIKHGVDKNIIEDEIAKIDNDLIRLKLNKLINKQARLKKGSYNSKKSAILTHFINLGYDKDDILKEMLTVDIKTDDDRLLKDYNRLYNKYKNKYDNDKLTYFLKQRLYQKGYTMDEINKVIK